MQYHKSFIFLYFLCVASFLGCENSNSGDKIEEQLAEIRQRYAPDRRTDRVEVSLDTLNNRRILTGYTTVAVAAVAIDSLRSQYSELDSEVEFYPQSQPAAAYGLVKISVANIRTRPGHSQELTSQALLGTPLELLTEDGGWYMVRTPDRYIAWLETGAIKPVSAAELEAWFGSELRTCVPAQTFASSQPGSGDIAFELVAGNLVLPTGRTEKNLTEVATPDGRTGWIATDDLKPYGETPSFSVSELLATAHRLRGRPYLWGGTSNKAMDCSGFTKTAYYLNGYVIPRDASQQVHAGVEVPLDEDFSQVQAGDLLFFGNLRDDGSQRITHVGFYLGNKRFLHAGADNGYITENSFDPADADYAEHRLKSLLRVKRLEPGGDGVVEVTDAFAM